MASLAIALALAVPAWAEQAPGATYESVAVMARKMSPDLAARALDADAARARVDVAGSLPDPILRITSDELDRMTGPRQNKMIYSVEQDIPLWGKRALRREAADAEVDQKTAEGKDAEAQLFERVKVAFALWYQTDRALDETNGTRPILEGIARIARDRYTHALTSQQEVIRAELETIRLASETARLEGVLRGARGRLNSLLLRPADAALDKPRAARPMPPAGRFEIAGLLQRGRTANPVLAANRAMIQAADRNAQIARRDWYPDITLSVGAIDRTGNGPNGYVASIGFKVPLQWGLHDGQVRDAAARANAARARLDAAEQQLTGDLTEAVAALEASRRAGVLSRERQIPQADAVLRSAVADYAAGKAEFTSVLQAERDLVTARIELLSLEFEQQKQLAAIERLIGGDL
jgi:outer membrane protein TolC